MLLDLSDGTLPKTKYQALFDARPAFDDLRASFLLQAGGIDPVDLECQLQATLVADAPPPEAALGALFHFV